MESYKIEENENTKIIKSPNFNCVFDKKTGFTATWGKTKEDDPEYCAAGPLILDLEIVAACRGVRDVKGKRIPCDFCYKSNTPVGKCMSFDTFKKVFDKMPPTLTQIAFGVDAEANMNPHLFQMMAYAREHGVIPNVTIADISNEVAQLISSLCGACAVSAYFDKKPIKLKLRKLKE